MEKDKEGILSTAKSAVVDTGAVVVDTAKVGLEGAKDLAVTAGAAVGGAVSAVAKKARKVVSRSRAPRKKVSKKGKVSRATVTNRAGKSTAKRPARKAAKAKGTKVRRATATSRAGRKSTVKRPARKATTARGTARKVRRPASTKSRSAKRRP